MLWICICYSKRLEFRSRTKPIDTSDNFETAFNLSYHISFANQMNKKPNTKSLSVFFFQQNMPPSFFLT